MSEQYPNHPNEVERTRQESKFIDRVQQALSGFSGSLKPAFLPVTSPDIETLLRGVPCFACHRPWGKAGLTEAQECGHVADAYGGADCWYVPDFPAMAQAVREAVEKETAHMPTEHALEIARQLKTPHGFYVLRMPDEIQAVALALDARAAEVLEAAADEVRVRKAKSKGYGALQLASDLDNSFRARAAALREGKR